MKHAIEFVEASQEIINDTFGKKDFNEISFNDLIYANQKMNYNFLATYLDCLQTSMKKQLSVLSYKEVIEDFLPAYKQTMKHLPSSYVLFSLMSFQQFYNQSFCDCRKSNNYKDIVSSLTTTLGVADSHLPPDYKLAISLIFPQYYKIKKGRSIQL